MDQVDNVADPQEDSKHEDVMTIHLPGEKKPELSEEEKIVLRRPTNFQVLTKVTEEEMEEEFGVMMTKHR